MICKRTILAAAMGIMAIAGSVPIAHAQVRTVDPDRAIDGDLDRGGQLPPVSGDPYANGPVSPPAQQYPMPSSAAPAVEQEPQPGFPAEQSTASNPDQPAVAQAAETTYKRDDLIGAAGEVFGEGAEGLARMLEDILSEQGEPNAYITGREAGGAFAVGVRYGSGTLHHKVEGERDVYWTGPSIGFDAGASGGSTFVLIYNLWDSQDLFERFPAGEGQAYIAAGLNAGYVRKGDIVLIPIRMGVGVRLGVNAGYLKFSEKQRWLPF